MINSRRRWFGLFFLLIALGMLIWGQTWLRDELTGLGYIIYWLSCFAVTMTALVIALLDARATRRSIRQQQVELLKDAFGSQKKDRDREKKPGTKPR